MSAPKEQAHTETSASAGPPSLLFHHGSVDPTSVAVATHTTTSGKSGGGGAPSPAGSGTIQDARLRVLNTFRCLPAYLLGSDVAVRRIDGLLAAMQQHQQHAGEAEAKASAEAKLQALSTLNDALAVVINDSEIITWEGSPYRGKDVFDALMNE